MRFFRPRPAELREDVEAELQFHLEMHARDLIAAGASPPAAREEAERRFGELRAVREACIAIDRQREDRARRREVFGEMFRDLRFALRTLGRSPGFTLLRPSAEATILPSRSGGYGITPVTSRRSRDSMSCTTSVSRLMK